MTDIVFKPRFSFEITEEQRQRIDTLLSAHGVRRAVFSPILDDVLDMIEKHGEKFIVAVQLDLAKPTSVVPCLKEAVKTLTELEDSKDGQLK